MTARAPGSNAPLRKGEKKGLELIAELTEQFMAKGMTEEEAKQHALKAMRDNPRKNYRGG